MTDQWTRLVNYIKSSKPLHAGVENALEDAYRVLSRLLSTDITLEGFQKEMFKWIDEYI